MSPPGSERRRGRSGAVRRVGANFAHARDEQDAQIRERTTGKPPVSANFGNYVGVTPLLAQRLRTDRSFERMYRRHVADVYRYALAVARNPSDAEDVTQTTFLNAYRAVQRGEQPRAAKNWLLSITHNVLRQRFRHAARRPDEVELHDAAGATVPHENEYSASDIQRALGELAFNQRAALVMRELEGRSYAEIAEILEVSVGAVETLIFRARRALREQLEGALTCHEAERAISLQLDGRLSRPEKGPLRAHLRTCKECATFARSQRAQRAALKGLLALPLPASLTSLFGGGAAAGSVVAGKAAAVTAVGLLLAGGTVETAKQIRKPQSKPVAAARAESRVSTPPRRSTPLVPTPRVAAGPVAATAKPAAAADVRRRAKPVPARGREAGAAARATPAADAPRGVPASVAGERSSRPIAPVRARGRAAAPGQLKPKTHAPRRADRAATPARVARPAPAPRPAVPKGHAKVRIPPAHGRAAKPAKRPKPERSRSVEPAPPVVVSDPADLAGPLEPTAP